MPHQRRHDSVRDSMNLLVPENHRERVVASALDSRLLAGARLGAAAESPRAMDDACSGWKKQTHRKGASSKCGISVAWLLRSPRLPCPYPCTSCAVICASRKPGCARKEM